MLAKTYTKTGKRKSSSARVRITSQGTGKFTINKVNYDEYFHGTSLAQIKIFQPFKVSKTENQFDTVVLVQGGGLESQADAISNGLSHALVEFNPGLKSDLKKAGLISRDSRTKERKKPGLKKARKAPQFSKR